MRRQLEYQISSFEPVTHKSDQTMVEVTAEKGKYNQVNENQENFSEGGSDESESSGSSYDGDQRDGSPRLKVKLDVKIMKKDRCYSLLGPYDTIEDCRSTIVKLYVIKMRTSQETKAQGSSPFKMGSMPINFFKMSIDLSRCSPETDNDLELRRFKQLVKEKLNLSDNFRIYNMQGHPIQDFEMSFLSQDDQSRSVVYVSSLAVSFDFETYLKMFKEIRKLGQGGFGQVFLSKHQITHEKYAIKIIQPNIQKADEASKAFKEAQVLQKLDHPNIIKLNNVFQLPDTRIILFMPHLKGGSLNDYLKENGNKVCEQTAQSIISEVANAIQFCHQRSIVHRDIKLENIMLRKRGDLSHGLVIIDFGIAGQLTRNEKQTEGTIRYAPPELLNGKNLTADTSFDVWSLGILLYRLISGAFPFEGKHLSELKSKILNQELAFPSELFTNVSDGSLALIKLMLNKQASQRPKLHQLILHPWFQITKNQQKLMNMTMYKNQQNTLTNFFNYELSNISALRSKRHHDDPDDIPARDLIVIDENLNLDSPLGGSRSHHHNQFQKKKSILKNNYSPSALSRGVQLDQPDRFTIVPHRQRGTAAFEVSSGRTDETPTNNIRDGGSRFVESALSLQMKKQRLNEKRSFKQEFDSLSVDRKGGNMDDKNNLKVAGCSNNTKLKKKKKRLESTNHQRNDTYGSSNINSIISGAGRLMQNDSQRSSVMTQKYQGLSLKPSRIISIGEHQNEMGSYNPLYMEIAQKPHSKFKKQSQVIRNGELGGSLDKRSRVVGQSLVNRDEIELPMIGSPIKKRDPQINQIIKKISQEIVEPSPSSKIQHQANKGSIIDGVYVKKQSAFFESTFEKSAGMPRNTSNTKLPTKNHHQATMIKGQVNIVNQNDLASEEPEIIRILEIQQQFLESKKPKAKSPIQRRLNEQQEPFVNVKLKLI